MIYKKIILAFLIALAFLVLTMMQCTVINGRLVVAGIILEFIVESISQGQDVYWS